MKNEKRLVKLDSQIVEMFDKDEMLMVKGGMSAAETSGDINLFQCHCPITNNCKPAEKAQV